MNGGLKNLEGTDTRPEAIALLAHIHARQTDLSSMLKRLTEREIYEDGVYRFYHQSFKVYGLQEATVAIVGALQQLRPDQPLNPWFLRIVADGTGHAFEPQHNAQWLEVTRPIVEAFMHARYFLEMVCRCGEELQEPPALMPSRWAAVLYLFNLR